MAAANKCTSAAGHFDGHGSALVPYGAHRPMQHDQGLTGSHWTQPLGNYSLRIAPVATRATITVSMVIVMRRYCTVRISRWRRFVAFIKATKRHHRASTRSARHQLDMPTPILGVYFIVKSPKRSLSCLDNNRGMTYQTDEKYLNNMSKYFFGVVNIPFNRSNNHFL